MKAGLGAIFGGLTLFAATAANAGVTVYDNRAAWEAAIGTVTNAVIPDPFTPSDFVVIGTGDVSAEYDSVTYLQATVSGTQQLAVYGATFTGGPAIVSSRNVSSPGAPNVAITLPSSVTAFAMNYGNEAGDTVQLILSNSFTQALSSQPGDFATPGFFGIVDTSPFDTVFLTASSGWLNVNQISFATSVSAPAPVPEASTWAMMIAGLAALAAVARRSRLRAA